MFSHGAIHLGDVPTWIAAIGTVGTLGWVVGLFRAQHRQQQQDAEREQASRVAAWVQESHWNYPHDGPPTGYCDVVVGNDSRLPVTDVNVTLLTWAWYDDHAKIESQAGSRWFPAVSPGGTTNPTPIDSAVPPDHLRTQHFNPPVMIEFYDAHHRHWRRLPDGVLELIPAPSP